MKRAISFKPTHRNMIIHGEFHVAIKNKTVIT